MNRGLFFVPCVAALFWSGCITPVKFQKSDIATPASWQHLTSSGTQVGNAPSVDQEWWKTFGDPTLDALIQEALQNNKSLAIAKSRVEEARANRGIARSVLFPQVSGDINASRGNQGFNTNNVVVSQAEATFNASWELDLFGHNQARAAQAQALLQSTQANEHAVVVGLLVEVARNYFDLRNDQQQLDIVQKNLENQKKTYNLVSAQVEGAMASNFDLQRAGAQVSATESEIPLLLNARDAALNRLNVLLGVPPGTKDAFLSTIQPVKPLDPHVLIAAPATVLANRPDVLAAERQFAAAFSAKRAAFADFFPRITLLGLYGVQTTNLFLTTPWNVAGDLAQPLLNFGLLRSQYKVASERKKQAFLSYQETVLEALENMENALSGFLNEYDRNRSLTTAVDQNHKAAELSELQFKGGFTGLLDVLIAQRDELNAESALSNSDATLRKNLVGIYAAAGGGWDIPDNKTGSKK